MIENKCKRRYIIWKNHRLHNFNSQKLCFQFRNKDLTELLDLEISENKICLFSYVGEQTALNFIDAGCILLE